MEGEKQSENGTRVEGGKERGSKIFCKGDRRKKTSNRKKGLGGGGGGVIGIGMKRKSGESVGRRGRKLMRGKKERR